MIMATPNPSDTFEDTRVLIVEDEPFIAWDLAQAVESAGGVVVGPAATVAHRLGSGRGERTRSGDLGCELTGRQYWTGAGISSSACRCRHSQWSWASARSQRPFPRCAGLFQTHACRGPNDAAIFSAEAGLRYERPRHFPATRRRTSMAR